METKDMDRKITEAFEGAFDKPINFDHKPTQEEVFLLRLRAVYEAGIREVVEWVNEELIGFAPTMALSHKWQSQLKEWGIE